MNNVQGIDDIYDDAEEEIVLLTPGSWANLTAEQQEAFADAATSHFENGGEWEWLDHALEREWIRMNEPKPDPEDQG